MPKKLNLQTFDLDDVLPSNYQYSGKTLESVIEENPEYVDTLLRNRRCEITLQADELLQEKLQEIYNQSEID